MTSEHSDFFRPGLHDTGLLFASDSFRQYCDAHCSYMTPNFYEPTHFSLQLHDTESTCTANV